jgi:RHS repeat-associated protein
LISTTESSVDGLKTWSTTWNNGLGVTRQTITAYASGGNRYVTNIAPDASYLVSAYKYGQLVSETRYDNGGNQLGQTSHGYDQHFRNNVFTDARNGSSTNWFNSMDQISGTKTPPPASGQSAQMKSNFFDLMGHVVATKLPDNTWETNRYGVNGLLTNKFGSRIYPVFYTYEGQGRMKTMTTYTNFASAAGAATTTWFYNQYRGWLDRKQYADGSGINYTNTPGGRLKNRVSARGINTTYTVNNAGDVATTSYSDTTTGVTSTFDRRGRVASVTKGSTTTSKTYNDAGNVIVESNSGDTLDGISVTNGFDHLLRRTNLVVFNGTTQLLSRTFAYAPGQGFATVSDGTNSASYSYLANSSLISQITFAQSGTTRMVTTKQYDFLNRLTNIVSTTNGAAISSFAYANNSANQRTSVTNFDATYWVYTYDSLGQVISGKKYWSDGTPVAGEQFEYAFDDIGNRTSTGEGGDSEGRNLRRANYSANNLNQYTSRDVPPYLTILGSAATNATVSLWADNGSFASTYRRNDFFRGELNFNNSTGSLWLTITNVGVLRNGANADIVTNVIGSAFVPQTAEIFGYDADGNMTNDGRWSISWDGENHLLTRVSLTNSPTLSKLRLTFGYDTQSRRIFKTVEAWTGSAWSVTLSNKFIYDGWNLTAELNGTNNALIRSYTWGADASGTTQGAGGVGGLISMTVHFGANSGTHFCCYNGNFNVMALMNATDGTLTAQYEYSPFGGLLRATGPMAQVNPFLFSTKFCDAETGNYPYGHRYYDASVGRWLSRDPLAENGGRNVQAFVCNSPINRVDADGRLTFTAVRSGPLDCGGWLTFWTVSSDQPPGGSYWYVAKVFGYSSWNTCSDAHRFNFITWYEAKLWDDNKDWYDEDSAVSMDETYGGVRETRVDAKLLSRSDSLDMAIFNWGHQAGGAGPMYSTSDAPTFWDDPGSIGSWEVDSATRISIRSHWECCCSRKMGNYVHIP